MDVLFVHFSHPLASKILSFYQRKKDNPKLGKAKLKKRIDPEIRFSVSKDISLYFLTKKLNWLGMSKLSSAIYLL